METAEKVAPRHGKPLGSPPKWSTRYITRLSTGKRLTVRVWQARNGGFVAKVEAKPELFTGSTHDEAMRRLVARYERVDFVDVKVG
jgi:hypothetical protein